LAIGHRGAAGITPENTKLSFVKALDLGADAIEFDVQLTRDDVAIIFHDDTLERTTDGKGRVNATDFPAIAKLDAGSWFGASFKGIEIPTLEETLKTLAGRVTLNIELKPDQRVEKLTKHVITAVARFEAFEHVIFSSFNTAAVAIVRRLVPSARIGILCNKGGLSPALELAERLGAETLNPHTSMIDHDLLERARARGLSVWTWTANEPGEISLLSALGVAGIFSDYPDRVANPRRLTPSVRRRTARSGDSSD